MKKCRDHVHCGHQIAEANGRVLRPPIEFELQFAEHTIQRLSHFTRGLPARQLDGWKIESERKEVRRKHRIS